jgi:hypothetical protein
MTKHRKATKDRGDKPHNSPRRVRLPGFLVNEELGLGDAIKNITYVMGIKPCGGCERRAQVLNRWMYFSRWR